MSSKKLTVILGKKKVLIKTAQGQTIWYGRGLRVTAYARDREESNWTRQIEFVNRDRARRSISLPPHTRTPARICEFLDSVGYKLPPGRLDQNALGLAILNQAPKARLTTVYRCGWHGADYLPALPGQTGASRFVLDEQWSTPARRRVSGSLHDWQKHVASLCASSSRLTFLLCTALAAPLIRFTSVESGGVHLFGRSTIGKSIGTRVAAGVHGSGARADGYALTWALTETSLEEMATGHSDGLLCLDELEELDSDPAAAAARATRIAYLLAGERPKSRSKSYIKVRADDRTWRLLMVSNGEVSLTAHSTRGSKSGRLAGEMVRVVDLPADPGAGHGIFDGVPKGFKNSRAAAEALEDAARQYYGSAGDAMIRRISAEIQANEKKLRRKLQKLIERFLKKPAVQVDGGLTTRFAKRFALAYAAGMLARQWKILPISKKTIARSVIACYRAAADYRDQQTLLPVNAAMAQLLDVVLKRQRARKGMSPTEARRAGVVRLRRQGKAVLAINPKLVDGVVPDQKLRLAVMNCLRDHQVLRPAPDGKLTRQVALGGPGRRRRCYVLATQKARKLQAQLTASNGPSVRHGAS